MNTNSERTVIYTKMSYSGLINGNGSPVPVLSLVHQTKCWIQNDAYNAVLQCMLWQLKHTCTCIKFIKIHCSVYENVCLMFWQN